MITNTILTKIFVIPNPIDVVLPNNYTYSVFVRDFPDTSLPLVNTTTIDNILINMSSTEYTMDQT